jgi:hypothetical protein
LDNVVRYGYSLFVGLLRCLGGVEGLAAEIEGFRTRVEQEGRWWQAEVAQQWSQALDAVDRMVAALARHNPKRAFCEVWHRRHPGGFVVARRRSIEEAKASGLLPTIQWLPASARGSREGAGLVSGWLGAETMTRLLVPPISESLTLALYEPERRWYETLRSRRAKTRSKLRKLVRRRSLVPLAVLGEVEEPEPRAFEPLPDEAIDRIRSASVSRRLGPVGSDPVEAKLFYFSDGSWAPFAPDHRVNDVTHLLTGEEGTDEKVREVRASELRPGDTILVHLGVEHDAIRHAADQQLPVGLRETAGEWRHAVRRFLERYEISDLHERLAKFGCKRDPQTLRYWERDESVIGPMREVETVRAIQSATGDETLQRRMEECLSAIRDVRHAHNLAARALAQRVLSRAKATLQSEGSGEPSDLGEGLALLAIDAIDSETISVARRMVNQIQRDS